MFKYLTVFACLLVFSCNPTDSDNWYITNGSTTEVGSQCIQANFDNPGEDPLIALHKMHGDSQLKIASKPYPDNTKFHYVLITEASGKHGITYSSSLARCTENLKESLEFINKTTIQ